MKQVTEIERNVMSQIQEKLIDLHEANDTGEPDIYSTTAFFIGELIDPKIFDGPKGPLGCPSYDDLKIKGPTGLSDEQSVSG